VFQGEPAGTVYIRSDLQEMNHRLKRYAGNRGSGPAGVSNRGTSGCILFQRAVVNPIVHLAEIARIVSRDKNLFHSGKCNR